MNLQIENISQNDLEIYDIKFERLKMINVEISCIANYQKMQRKN